VLRKKEINHQVRPVDRKKVSSKVRPTVREEFGSKKTKGTNLLLARIGKIRGPKIPLSTL